MFPPQENMGLGWNVRVKNEKLEREIWHEYDQITIYALQNSQKLNKILYLMRRMAQQLRTLVAIDFDS